MPIELVKSVVILVLIVGVPLGLMFAACWIHEYRAKRRAEQVISNTLASCRRETTRHYRNRNIKLNK